MKKLLCATTFLLSCSVSFAFAQNPSPASSINPTKVLAVSHLKGSGSDSCILDAIGNSLTTMLNQGLHGNAVTFSSSSNVEKTLQNLQSSTCAHTQGIKISTVNGLVLVQRSSSRDNYTFYAWYKDGQAISAILTSDYKIA